MAKKTWLRWTQTSREFPKSKYNFTQHLRKVGDYVVTEPLPNSEYQKIKHAAKFWAWYHGVMIKTEKTNLRNGTFIIKIQLISRKRVPRNIYE